MGMVLITVVIFLLTVNFGLIRRWVWVTPQEILKLWTIFTYSTFIHGVFISPVYKSQPNKVEYYSKIVIIHVQVFIKKKKCTEKERKGGHAVPGVPLDGRLKGSATQRDPSDSKGMTEKLAAWSSLPKSSSTLKCGLRENPNQLLMWSLHTKTYKRFLSHTQKISKPVLFKACLSFSFVPLFHRDFRFWFGFKAQTSKKIGEQCSLSLSLSLCHSLFSHLMFSA